MSNLLFSFQSNANWLSRPCNKQEEIKQMQVKTVRRACFIFRFQGLFSTHKLNKGKFTEILSTYVGLSLQNTLGFSVSYKLIDEF